MFAAENTNQTDHGKPELHRKTRLMSNRKSPNDWLRRVAGASGHGPGSAGLRPGSDYAHSLQLLKAFKARVPGDAKLKVIEDAPGSYVKMK